MIAPTHVYTTHVFYEDTDASGVVYHANYLKFAERARSALLTENGLTHQALKEQHGLGFVVHSLSIQYASPARLEDSLKIYTKVLELKRASVKVEQIIYKDDTLLASLTVGLAVVDQSGRPRAFPESVRTVFLEEPKRDIA